MENPDWNNFVRECNDFICFTVLVSAFPNVPYASGNYQYIYRQDPDF